MLSRYNAYFHAQLRLDENVESLKTKNKDDFNNILRVYPYGGEDEANTIANEMDEVMKKCSRVIQDHPNSKWEDDCFFLVGQAHFFKFDPYAAIETFQFVYTEYPESKVKYRAQIWIMKCYLRQNNLDNAESILSLIKQETDFPKEFQFELNATAGDLYAREGKYTVAIQYLEKALSQARKRDEKYRLHFILGQLYNKTENYALAVSHFDRVIRMNPPYDFIFQSNLFLASLIEKTGKSAAKNARKHLKRMLKDDKNIDYFDQIYFELGRLEEKSGNMPQAIEYFNLSLRNNKGNKTQLANTYLYLARYYFDAKDYTRAQAYYDSCSFNISPEHPDYNGVIARQKVLSVLTENLTIVEVQDSLLQLASLPLDEISKRVDEQIKREKQLEEERLRKEEENKNNPLPDNNFPGGVPGGPPGGVPGGSPGSGAGGLWYFYNQSTLASGFNDFTRLWGNREHTDYWRVNSKARAITRPQLGGNAKKEEKEEDKILKYNENTDTEKQEILKGIEKEKQKYYLPLPLSPASKKVAHAKIEEALFKIGKIYQYDLKECETSYPYYQKLLDRYPDTKLGAETVFNLHKCYKDAGNQAKADELAKLLATKYPSTTYNDIVNRREVAVNSSEDKKIENFYQTLYEAYLKGEYQSVMAKKLEFDKTNAGHPFQARFDYLYALCVAKTQGVDAYLPLLKILVETYPSDPVAKEARNTIDFFERKNQVVKDTVPQKFKDDPREPYLYMLVLNGVKADKAEVAFNEYNRKSFPSEVLKVKTMFLDGKEVITIQGLANKSRAEKYYVDLLKQIDLFLSIGINNPEYYYISENNLKIILSGTPISEYKTFFEKIYIP